MSRGAAAKLMALFLLALLILTGCGDRQDVLDAGQIAMLQVGEKQIPAAETEIVLSLVDEFNEAKYRRQAKSGPATHRLILVTLDGAQYTLLRISEDLVEVGLRHGEQRKSFFLSSSVLSQQVKTICQDLSTKAGP